MQHSGFLPSKTALTERLVRAGSDVTAIRQPQVAFTGGASTQRKPKKTLFHVLVSFNHPPLTSPAKVSRVKVKVVDESMVSLQTVISSLCPTLVVIRAYLSDKNYLKKKSQSGILPL